MRQESSDMIPAEHAVLAGHFPGNPVVPAVVILDRVGSALDQWCGAAPITRISHAKFVAVLRPEEKFKIRLRSHDLRNFAFECEKEKDGVRFAYGEVLAESRHE
jgi:3-hydroxyacyl-[acyl-carrier-protein] dehydratase